MAQNQQDGHGTSAMGREQTSTPGRETTPLVVTLTGEQVEAELARLRAARNLWTALIAAYGSVERLDERIGDYEFLLGGKP